MQHLDNMGDCDEDDFDDYYSINPNKPYTVEKILEHHFDYTDANGEERQLYTEVQAVWRVVHGSYSYDAPSDLDFRGYSELQEWSVSGYTDSYGESTYPKHVLTPEQLQEYNLDLIKFIEG